MIKIVRYPLSAILLVFLESKAASQSSLSLAELLGKLQQRGFGVVLFLCALICMVPMPGPNAILAIPLFIIAAQMLVNKRRLWLPNFVTQRRANSLSVLSFYKKILRYLQFIEKLTKPRLPHLVPRKNLAFIGVVVGISAVAIALPLPVPGSNTIPSFTLVVVGLGMFARDGLLVVLGSIAALLVSFGLFGLVFFVFNKLDFLTKAFQHIF